ncbi:MAG: proline--tRNA ligase [Candidatus Methanoplasma sp.]|nr:proline--tRNA ligase [Candidatus Methanoplasma sp.]
MEKEDNFGDWYLDIVEKANLSDKRYPVKGMNVWTPYGWKAMSNIDGFIRKELDATGHDEVCFPLMIPETEFKKEKEHIKGFDSEVYWVTHAGLNELDVKLVLRPTSETAMYPMFALWVRSHHDLPLKVYQIVNTFRYETKQTRAFMRVREIHFFESHTCHVSEEDAQRQIAEDVDILSKIARSLCLPYFLSVRTDWDKFPGAYYTIGIDTVMPNGRTLQIGSIHQYRTNFSEPYEITYEDENGEHKHVHQTTYGMSERLLGAVIGMHSDDKGLIMPPDIAPFQTVVIPIVSKDNRQQVTEAARALAAELSVCGIRTKLDDRDARPGSKYYDWEIKGVPLRLEIGGRDIENGVVTFARRDTGEKGTISLKSVAPGAELLLSMISASLREKAEMSHMSKMEEIDSPDRISEGKILKFGWCGCEECGHKFEDTYGLKILGTPYLPERYEGRCMICGKDADRTVLAARTM